MTTALGEITLADLNLRPLDVLQLARTASGVGGASELDRRIAWTAVNLPAAPTGVMPDEVSITYSRDPAWSTGMRSFPELLELARSINAALGRARPLTPADLLTPDSAAFASQAQPVIADVRGRANAVYQALTGAITNLQAAIDATPPIASAIAAKLSAISFLNLPAAVPRSIDLPSLIVQAGSILDTARRRRGDAGPFIATMTAQTGWEAVDAARSAVQAILGGDLLFVAGFLAVEAHAGELAQAMAAEPQLLASAKLAAGEPVRRWLAGTARVRPPLDLWRRVALYSAAQGAGARSWTVSQLPYRPGDSWLGLPTAGFAPRAGVVSLVLDRVVPPQAGSACAGLLLDEWSENHSLAHGDDRRRAALSVTGRAGAAVDSAGSAADVRRQLGARDSAVDRQRDARSRARPGDRFVSGRLGGTTAFRNVARHEHRGRFGLDRLPQPASH